MTTQTQFDHKMTRQALDMRFTKAELYEMIRDQTSYTVTRAMSKQELVDIAWMKVALLKQGEEERAAEAAAIRSNELTLAYANERYIEALNGLALGLDKVLNCCKEQQSEFEERAKKYGLADAIEWRAENVFVAAALQDHVTALRNFVLRTKNSDAAEDRRTIAEFIKNLDDMITTKTNWILESTQYRYNSSSAGANLRGACNFKAEQRFCKLLKDVKAAFEHDLTIDPENPMSRYSLYFTVHFNN